MIPLSTFPLIETRARANSAKAIPLGRSMLLGQGNPVVSVDVGVLMFGIAGVEYVSNVGVVLEDTNLVRWELTNPMRLGIVAHPQTQQPVLAMSDMCFGNTKQGVYKTKDIVIPCSAGAVLWVLEPSQDMQSGYAGHTSRITLASQLPTGGLPGITRPMR